MRSFGLKYPANSVLIKQIQKGRLFHMELSLPYYIKTDNKEAGTQKNSGNEGDIFHLRINKFRSQESGQRSHTEIAKQASKVVIDKAFPALRTCRHRKGAAHSDTVYAADNACCNYCKRNHHRQHLVYFTYYIIR